MPISRPFLLLVVLAMLPPAAPAAAQAVSAAEVKAMREEIAALRSEIAALRTERSGPAPTATGDRAAPVEPAPAAAGPAPIETVAVFAAEAPPPLQVSGDLRFRYETNFGGDAVLRERLSMRGRLRAAYAVTERAAVGVQLTTGDPDDPNTGDVTLTEYDDDFKIALDQMYLRYRLGGLTATAGKFATPFVRTDLVWDPDVNPQGVAARYEAALGRATVSATGLYFVVDEAAAGPDADMLGGQLSAIARLGEWLSVEGAVGLYDYELRSVAGADAGDFRTNRRAPNGRYLSDFDLLDVIVAAEWRGLGEAWPVRLSGDFVRNLGAVDGEDSGFAIDLLAGRIKRAGEWRFGYGYSQAEVDAVLAAFAQDNIPVGSNYRSHAATIDYAVRDDIVLNATLYRYRTLESSVGDDWLSRLRLGVTAGF